MILSFCTKCFSATFQSFCTFLSFIFYFYYYLLFYVSVSSSLLSATLFLFVKVLILLSPILSFVHILSKSFSALHTLSLSGRMAHQLRVGAYWAYVGGHRSHTGSSNRRRKSPAPAHEKYLGPQ